MRLMMYRWGWAYLVFGWMLATGCKRETLPAVVDLSASQSAYFPLETGKYVVFTADSVVYDFGPGGETVRDSSRTWVREIVGDTLRNNNGLLEYAIERYERKSQDDPWQLVSIGTAARTGSQAIRTENNLRFLKMVFPMNKHSAWDGNLWIDPDREIQIAGENMRPFSNWNYQVDSIDISLKVGPLSFDSTLVITEADDNNVIERRLSKVIYAKHVGRIWREQWILDSQYCNQIPPPTDCATKPWEQKAQKGYILREAVVEHN
jgi:hypothetical protein